jgi:hypothetical protein
MSSGKSKGIKRGWNWCKLHTGIWRRLLSEELHNLYISPNIIKVIKLKKVRWVRHVSSMREMRNAYKILVRKLEGKRPHGRPRCRWEDNIRDLRDVV